MHPITLTPDLTICQYGSENWFLRMGHYATCSARVKYRKTVQLVLKMILWLHNCFNLEPLGHPKRIVQLECLLASTLLIVQSSLHHLVNPTTSSASDFSKPKIRQYKTFLRGEASKWCTNNYFLSLSSSNKWIFLI